MDKQGQDHTITTVKELFALSRADALALLERKYSKAGQAYIEFVMSCYDLYHELREGLYATGRPD